MQDMRMERIGRSIKVVEQYYSAKWKIMQAFDKGKLPKEINCSGVKRETIYAYYQEWKRDEEERYHIYPNVIYGF